MFANARPAQQSSTGHLVEFKAGRFHYQPGSSPEKRKVVADKTKGLIFIKQTNDQLMHFCWKNRETGAVIEDLIIFPGDTEFVRVRECTDGRVYMLKFKTSDQRNLFWMQDGKTDKDDELCRKVNEVLNNSPTSTGLVRAAGRGGERAQQFSAAMGGGAADELGALGGLDQQQLMHLLSLMNQGGHNMPSLDQAAALLPQLSSHLRSARDEEHHRSTTAERAATATTRHPGAPSTTATVNPRHENTPPPVVQLAQLQDIISSINANTGDGASAHAPIEFADVVTGDAVGECVRRNEDRLTPHIPQEIGEGSGEVAGTLRTPQFRQAADIFGQALQSGQLAPVLPQFGISEAASRSAASGDILKFAESLTETESLVEEKKKDEEDEGKETEEADQMDLD